MMFTFLFINIRLSLSNPDNLYNNVKSFFDKLRMTIKFRVRLCSILCRKSWNQRLRI